MSIAVEKGFQQFQIPNTKTQFECWMLVVVVLHTTSRLGIKRIGVGCWVLECLSAGYVFVLLKVVGSCWVMYDMLDIGCCGSWSYGLYFILHISRLGIKRTGLDAGRWVLEFRQALVSGVGPCWTTYNITCIIMKNV